MIEIFEEPLKLAVPVTSPDKAIFLAVCKLVAVPAFPFIDHEIIELNVLVPAIV